MRYQKHIEIFNLISNHDLRAVREDHDDIYQDSDESIKKGEFYKLYAPFEVFQKIHELGWIKRKPKFRKILVNDEGGGYPSNESIYDWMEQNQGYEAGAILIFIEDPIPNKYFTQYKFLFNGKSIYYSKQTSKIKSKFMPLQLNHIVGKLEYTSNPVLTNLFLNMICHMLGKEKHFVKEYIQFTDWTGCTDSLLNALKIPLMPEKLKINKTKLEVLNELKGKLGKVSNFSGRLPLQEAITFILTTKRVPTVQYDLLVNYYKSKPEMRALSDPEDILLSYFMDTCKHMPSYLFSESCNGEDANDVKRMIIRDYLSITKRRRKQVNLSLSSISRINDIHIELSIGLKKPSIKKVEKCFLDVKISGWEIIKTGKRLAEEGLRMRHCVGQYAKWINKGLCGIYSTTFNGQNYTIELQQERRKKHKNLIVSQVRGMYNKVAPVELSQLIENQIKEVNEKNQTLVKSIKQ